MACVTQSVALAMAKILLDSGPIYFHFASFLSFSVGVGGWLVIFFFGWLAMAKISSNVGLFFVKDV